VQEKVLQKAANASEWLQMQEALTWSKVDLVVGVVKQKLPILAPYFL
jgi:hypothetical protein